MRTRVAKPVDPRKRSLSHLNFGIPLPSAGSALKPVYGEPPTPFDLCRFTFRRLIPEVRRADVSGKVFVALQQKVPRDLFRRLVLGRFPWPEHPAALRTTQKPRLHLPDQFARHGLVYACGPAGRKRTFHRSRRSGKL